VTHKAKNKKIKQAGNYFDERISSKIPTSANAMTFIQLIQTAGVITNCKSHINAIIKNSHGDTLCIV